MSNWRVLTRPTNHEKVLHRDNLNDSWTIEVHCNIRGNGQKPILEIIGDIHEERAIVQVVRYKDGKLFALETLANEPVSEEGVQPSDTPDPRQMNL